ncbi:MAG: hypothetical protein ACK4NC_00425 [Candidatus Gracilibacteria bacterium]
MMHSPAMILFPLSTFLLVSGLILLFVWCFKYSDKKTQLRLIITLLILGLLGAAAGTFMRVHMMKDIDANPKEKGLQMRGAKDVKYIKMQDKMNGSGSMMITQ